MIDILSALAVMPDFVNVVVSVVIPYGVTDDCSYYLVGRNIPGPI